MSEFKTRDELAISMPMDALPELKTAQSIEIAAKIVGIDIENFNEDNEEEGLIMMSNLSHRWHAYNRYLYADAMIAMREETLNNQSDTTDREGKA